MQALTYDYDVYFNHTLVGIIEASSIDEAREEAERIFNKSAVLLHVILSSNQCAQGGLNFIGPPKGNTTQKEER